MRLEQFRSCPNDETLAAFINRRLSKASYRMVEQHVLACDNCYAIFGSVIGFEEWSRGVEPSPSRGTRSRLAYLAFGIAILAALVRRLALRDGNASGRRLESIRTIVTDFRYRTWEGRLSCCPFYLPYEPAGQGQSIAPERLRRLQSKVSNAKSVSDMHAAAIAEFVMGEGIDRPAERLLVAVRSSDREQSTSDAIAEAENASVVGDLAVVMLERSRRSARRTDTAVALAAAERAYRLERTAASMWNRALALESAFGADAARDAWQQYLANECDAQWAMEARRHVQRPVR